MTAERREAVTQLKTGHEMSERRACGSIEMSRSVYRYEPLPNRDLEIGEALQGLAAKHPEIGFRKFF